MGRTASVGVHFCFDDVEVPGIGLCYIEGYASGDIVNIGIGSYEFWGAKCVDNRYGIEEFDISLHEVSVWNDTTEEWEKRELTKELVDKVEEALFDTKNEKLTEMLEEESHEEPYHPEA